MAIKVRAINPGHYGFYRNPGDEFEIKEDKHFSKNWMEKVDAEPKAKAAPVAKASEKKSTGDKDVI